MDTVPSPGSYSFTHTHTHTACMVIVNNLYTLSFVNYLVDMHGGSGSEVVRQAHSFTEIQGTTCIDGF